MEQNNQGYITNLIYNSSNYLGNRANFKEIKVKKGYGYKKKTNQKSSKSDGTNQSKVFGKIIWNYKFQQKSIQKAKIKLLNSLADDLNPSSVDRNLTLATCEQYHIKYF